MICETYSLLVTLQHGDSFPPGGNRSGLNREISGRYARGEIFKVQYFSFRELAPDTTSIFSNIKATASMFLRSLSATFQSCFPRGSSLICFLAFACFLVVIS